MKHSDLGVLDGPVLLCGGPYSNAHALAAFTAEAKRLGVPASAMICTGDVVAYAAGRSAGDLLRWCTFSAPPTIAPSARHRAPVELRWPAGSTVELRLDLS